MTRSRKVLVVRNAYDKDCGGAEQYALNLCVELQHNGLSPMLMTRVPDLVKKADKMNVPVIEGKWHSSQEWGKHYFLRLPLMVIWYMYIILKYRFDIIHPQGRDDFIFASIAGGLLGRKVVWTDHADLKYILDLKIHPFPYLRSWTLWASRFTNKIICVSDAEKGKISVNAPDFFVNKLVTIHNGVASVDTSYLGLIERPSAPLVVANSRLVPDKGIKELIEMTSRLKYRNLHLWIVGGYSGNETMYKDIAEKFEVADKVTLVGYVDNPNEYVSMADIFVHASYHEAFSLAIVEAAMLSKPIIATNVGGAPEIIDDTCGILVPPKDTDALVRAVDDLLSDPERAKMYAHNAGEKAEKYFVFSSIVKERVLPLYG